MKKKMAQIKMNVEESEADALRGAAHRAGMTLKGFLMDGVKKNMTPLPEKDMSRGGLVSPRIIKAIEDSVDFFGGFDIRRCGELVKLEGLTWSDLNKDEQKAVVGRWLEHVRYWEKERSDVYDGCEVFAKLIEVDVKTVLRLLRTMEDEAMGTSEKE